MEKTKRFTGLGMPVFTAFGWAGEETAIKFALSQLEQFINELYADLPGTLQKQMPVHGLDEEVQGVYLAPGEEMAEDIHIAFYARPMSLEIQLAIKDKDVLAKGLKQAEDQPAVCHRLVTELGPEWALHVQQMEVNEETGEASHYQDLFKDSVSELDQGTAVAVFAKAHYLNAEDQWLTPVYLSRRFPSEQVAAMGTEITMVMAEQVESLMPVLAFLSGEGPRKKAKSKPKPKVTAEEAAAEEIELDPEEGFIYVSELKPLHIRRGFVNLTSDHWPFFAVNSRTETRPVTIYYSGVYDKKSSVWRLVPNDQARLVLSPPVHEWLEDHFSPGDKIHLLVRQMDDEEIQVSLRAV
jgi:hypothetical protein